MLGPGLITSNVDNDAGGISTYSLAGAQFGYALLWSLIPMTIALYVTEEMCARMAVVTGKGLSDLIREEFGFRPTFFVMVTGFLVDLGNVVAEFAGVASAMEIFGVSRYIAVPIAGFVVWLLVLRGTYRQVEKVFLALCTFYLAYAFSAILAKPGLAGSGAAHGDSDGAIQQQLSADGDGAGGHDDRSVAILLPAGGLCGEARRPAAVCAGARGRDCRQRELHGDRVLHHRGYGRHAVYVSGHRNIADAADAARALVPLAGRWASLLFAFGLLNASLFAASILPLSTAHVICEGLGFEAGIDHKFNDAPIFYWLYTILIVVGGGLILIPRAPLWRILVLSQVANGVWLPIVLIFMILLDQSARLDGRSGEYAARSTSSPG